MDNSREAPVDLLMAKHHVSRTIIVRALVFITHKNLIVIVFDCPTKLSNFNVNITQSITYLLILKFGKLFIDALILKLTIYCPVKKFIKLAAQI